jgi:hypothetical protein
MAAPPTNRQGESFGMRTRDGHHRFSRAELDQGTGVQTHAPYRTLALRPPDSRDVDVALFGARARRERRDRLVLAAMSLVLGGSVPVAGAFELSEAISRAGMATVHATVSPVPAIGRLPVRAAVPFPCPPMSEQQRQQWEIAHDIDCFPPYAWR